MVPFGGIAGISSLLIGSLTTEETLKEMFALAPLNSLGLVIVQAFVSAMAILGRMDPGSTSKCRIAKTKRSHRE
jgi:hypothetical protein